MKMEKIKKLEVECFNSNEIQKTMFVDIISLKNKINLIIDYLNNKEKKKWK